MDTTVPPPPSVTTRRLALGFAAARVLFSGQRFVACGGPGPRVGCTGPVSPRPSRLVREGQAVLALEARG